MTDMISLDFQTYVLGRVEQNGVVAGWYLVPVIMRGNLLGGLTASVRLPRHEMNDEH